MAMVLSVFLAPLARPVAGQTLHTVVEPRARVFPAVGAGVTALKRDSSGRYYILAKPASVISIYSSDGSLVGKIPNANSHGATIRFAVDIDLDASGRLYVVDRGANAIEIFNPDGTLAAKVQVLDPTSIVALTGGQFAVTTLTSRRLVLVMDEDGRVVRSFGDPADFDQNAKEETLIDRGRIVGDSAGYIYFAFKSLPDPTLRKYDRYGYVGYQATVPKSFFEAGSTEQEDRVEFGVDFTHISLADQATGSFTLGSSGDVKFGAGLGMGLSEAFAQGGGFGRGAAAQNMWQQGPVGGPGGYGGGTLGGMVTGEVTSQGTQFQFGAGRMASGRGGGRGRSGSAITSDSTTPSGTLQFLGPGSGNSNDDNSGFSATAQDIGTNGDSADAALAFGASGTQDGLGGTEFSDPGFGANYGLPADFLFGSMLNSVGVRPQGPPGFQVFGAGGGSSFDHVRLGDTGGRGPEGGAGGHFGGYHGQYRGSEAGFRGTVKVNLGDLGTGLTDKPVITATGVDPVTHEMWAGIGDALIHFNRDGSPVEVYYLTMNGGTPLKPTAVLVEPDRFLIATDPWGIFEFPRATR
ncbi:MAG: hypothetical protein WAM96_16880 [Candidatus Acidiferrales bacterium]